MQRDWLADRQHENGNYVCQCRECSNEFRGHKRRIICYACAQAVAVHGDTPITDAGYEIRPIAAKY
jgi:Zn finger protein HypA/HybF involved in hydrogenase expression